jgi:hypothetical protein
MRTFFGFSLLLSFVLGLYSVGTSVTGTAHNHYETRYNLLYDIHWRDVSPSWWELSEADVSAQPEKYEKAYRQAVLDGHSLGIFSESLQSQCIVLAAGLFVVSCVGWWAAQRIKHIEKGIVQQTLCGEPGAFDRNTRVIMNRPVTPTVTLIASVVVCTSNALIFGVVFAGWPRTWVQALFAAGLFISPALAFVTARDLWRTGCNVRLLLAALLSGIGFAFWCAAVYFVILRHAH